MNSVTYRRIFGLIIGLAIGLAFSLVSQGINYLVIPGLPLYFPPFGAPGNILLGTLLGALIGLVSAWSENSALGVILASFTGAIAVTLANYFTGSRDPSMMSTKIAGLVIIFVPVMAMIALIIIPVRWAINREEASRRALPAIRQEMRLSRILLPGSLLLAAALLGLTNLYPAPGRMAIPRMQAVIQEGRQAATVEELPESLRPPDVDRFLENGQAPYTLRWEKDENNRFAIPRPPGELSPSIVIAEFENMWKVVCVYTSSSRPPECRDFQN